MEEPGATKRPSVLTIDRAAFLLLRVKRAFKKKRQQRKEKQCLPGAICALLLQSVRAVCYTSNESESAYLTYQVSLSLLYSSQAATNVSGAVPSAVKTVLDPKRRNDLVDEAFLEQKDVLLEMLEAKLKEVRDKKKKKGDSISSSNTDPVKCEPLPKNVDLNLKAHGISAIGEADVNLKFGNSGNGTLKLDASGISNIGETHVNLGVGDGSVHIPGLNNIFRGPSFLKKPCEPVNQSEVSPSTNVSPNITEIKEIDKRRMNNKNENVTLNKTLNNSTNIKSKVAEDKLNENIAQKETQDNKRNDSATTNNVVTVTTNANEIAASSNTAAP